MQPLVFLAFVIPVLSQAVIDMLTTGFVGYAGQWVKAHQKFPTVAAQAIMFVVGVGFFALGHHPSAADAAWLDTAVKSGLAVVGAASLAAGLGAAPKTDSIPK